MTLVQYAKVKHVLYEELEDYYLVLSLSNSTVSYRVNRLKDSKHWFCECRAYQYCTKRIKTCKHIQRIKVVDQMRKKGLLTSKW